ncbi:MAG TPA: cytochrome c1 [Devosiaceae bacterium]|jgi:ubiquinol-cytochrome c reductase cytochrome c1 subunit
MTLTKSFFAALAITASLVVAAPAFAQEGAAEPHIQRQPWSFAGIFGTYDQNQLQRGFQVFREVCSGCHAAKLLTFRNLSEEGGPHFSEGQVKELAAQYDIADPDAPGGTRKGIPADAWPAQLAPADAAATFGAVPPDFSVLANARGVEDPFPTWLFNFFTTYQEGGPDYIHALLNGYHDEVPADAKNADGTPFQLPDGKHYNDVFPGHAISMPPPLADGQVTYAEPAEGGTAVPQTAEQYSADVSAFMMWLADPHLAARKEAGFRVILFLILFAGLMYFTKRKLWKGIEH